MKMTLFHVFFLVSLLWAVHSHGRAYETECITYSNTQLPYKENMSAETLMPRQLFAVDYYYLVLNWPATYCSWRGVSCWHPIRNYFTVHGLWPQPHGSSRFCCNRNARPLLIQHLGHELENRLDHIWPSLVSGYDSYYWFWKHEYEKHGSCFSLFFRTPVQYFQLTVRMMDQLSDLTRNLENQGVRSGHSYEFEHLREMIRRATGFIPRLECDSSNQLYQIYFCASRAQVLTNCEDMLNININNRCRSWVRFPSPHLSRRGP